MQSVSGRYDESRRIFEVRLNPSNTLVKFVDISRYSIPRSSRLLGVFSQDDEVVVVFGGGVNGDPQVEIGVDRWGSIRRTQI